MGWSVRVALENLMQTKLLVAYVNRAKFQTPEIDELTLKRLTDVSKTKESVPLSFALRDIPSCTSSHHYDSCNLHLGSTTGFFVGRLGVPMLIAMSASRTTPSLREYVAVTHPLTFSAASGQRLVDYDDYVSDCEWITAACRLPPVLQHGQSIVRADASRAAASRGIIFIFASAPWKLIPLSFHISTGAPRRAITHLIANIALSALNPPATSRSVLDVRHVKSAT
ncbi:hypothetical protein EVAR_39890_1 [Eumeta japonica]|uniref:Uncharacterized protein n=1 Tax=Eumeta variegata TaxID=151549 RepID=A0A4C1WMB5_EUMVA|nr:hypothetical protein EVAR_39890_1 [Eumeta japonica]